MLTHQDYWQPNFKILENTSGCRVTKFPSPQHTLAGFGQGKGREVGEQPPPPLSSVH